MASDNKIANELFDSFTVSKYQEYCSYLSDRDAVSLTVFKNSQLSHKYWLDVRRCFVNDKVNVNHVLELFCDYCEMQPLELRQKVLDIVKKEYKFWDHAASVVLHMKWLTLAEWITQMEKPTSVCDELMLYVLSRIFYRHTLVHTLHRTWATLYTESPLDADSLHDKCDVHLVYLGEYMYGELRPLPMLQPPHALQAPDHFVVPKQRGRPKKALDLRVQSVKCTAATELNELTARDEPCSSTTPTPTTVVADLSVLENDKYPLLSACSNQSGAPDDIRDVTLELDCNTTPQPVSDKGATTLTETGKSEGTPDPMYLNAGDSPNIVVDHADTPLPSESTIKTNTFSDASFNQTGSEMGTDSIKRQKDNIAFILPTEPADLPNQGFNQTGSEPLLQDSNVAAPPSGPSDNTGVPVAPEPADSPNPGFMQTGSEPHPQDSNVAAPPSIPSDNTDVPEVPEVQGIVKLNCVNSLKSLAGKSLRKNFPGMDNFEIAEAIEKHNQKALINPARLSVLCYKTLEQRFDLVEINKGLDAIRPGSGIKSKLPTVSDEQKLTDYLKALALKRKVSVTIQKLKPEIVKLQTKSHWTNIDPYSDIEEVNSETDNDHSSSDTSESKEQAGLFFECHGGHVLRRRKRNYTVERSRRPSSRDTYYRDMCDDSATKKRRKSREAAKPANIGLKDPSLARLRSQQRILEAKENRRQGIPDEKKLVQSYPLFQPVSDKSEKTRFTDELHSEHDYDSDDTIPAPLDVKPTNILLDGPVKEYGIKTKTFGIKKPVKKKRVRFYRCPTCKKKFDKLALLNRHYKDTHSPLTCQSCNEQFSTPSTLERHSYKHKSLKYTCKVCGKGFPFVSNRDSHELSHSTDKNFKCADCDKAYISKGDLVKHEKTHEKKTWNCRLCEYTSFDERNLKAHMRKHSKLKPYICNICLKLFKYHTQWKRHFPCKGKSKNEDIGLKPKLKRSKSPDY